MLECNLYIYIFCVKNVVYIFGYFCLKKKGGGVIIDNVCKWRKFLVKVFIIFLLNLYFDVYF